MYNTNECEERQASTAMTTICFARLWWWRRLKKASWLDFYPSASAAADGRWKCRFREISLNLEDLGDERYQNYDPCMYNSIH